MEAHCIIFLSLVAYDAAYDFFQYPGFGYGTLTGTCIKGYTGESCRHKCPYPHFGSFCSEKCDCIKSFCNHIYGCKKSATNCPVGFTGKYCEKQCSYPNYGIGCQQSCSCSKPRCNASTGCQFIKTVTKKNSYKMNPFNTARSYSHKTTTFKKISNDSFKQTSVPPVITDKKETASIGKPLQQVGAKGENKWVQLCLVLSGLMLFGLSIGHIVLSIIQWLKESRK